MKSDTEFEYMAQEIARQTDIDISEALQYLAENGCVEYSIDAVRDDQAIAQLMDEFKISKKRAMEAYYNGGSDLQTARHMVDLLKDQRNIENG